MITFFINSDGVRVRFSKLGPVDDGVIKQRMQAFFKYASDMENGRGRRQRATANAPHRTGSSSHTTAVIAPERAGTSGHATIALAPHRAGLSSHTTAATAPERAGTSGHATIPLAPHRTGASSSTAAPKKRLKILLEFSCIYSPL